MKKGSHARLMRGYHVRVAATWVFMFLVAFLIFVMIAVVTSPPDAPFKHPVPAPSVGIGTAAHTP